MASQPEYRRLRSIAKQAAKYNLAPFTVVRDQHREVLTDWRSLLEHVKSEGTREINIQRYKGLGEMNPGQLWETTLDTNARSLLQVKVKEVDEADDIFTKLMGDVVEPRREFIQDNSLSANVDV